MVEESTEGDAATVKGLSTKKEKPLILHWESGKGTLNLRAHLWNAPASKNANSLERGWDD